MSRWSLIVSDDTDQRLRAFLGSQGAKKGSLSRFVEEAVMQRLQFEETVETIQNRNIQFEESHMMHDIKEAINNSRQATRHASGT